MTSLGIEPRSAGLLANTLSNDPVQKKIGKSGFLKHENQRYIFIIATLDFYEYILKEGFCKMRFC